MKTRNVNIQSKDKRDKMTVSKAELPIMDSYLGEKLIQDIKKTKLNDILVNDCKSILKALIEKRRKATKL